MMDRRSFLRGLVAMPAVVAITNIMPVKALASGLFVPDTELVVEKPSLILRPQPEFGLVRVRGAGGLYRWSHTSPTLLGTGYATGALRDDMTTEEWMAAREKQLAAKFG